MADLDARTVLYIEDDAAYILLVRRALQRSKLGKLPNLRVFTTSEEAIRYLSGQPPYQDRLAHPLPSLLLTDLRLPGKSGLYLVNWVKKQAEFEQMPIVMLTGSALDEDIESAYELGVNFCLVKPAEVEMLVSIIHALSVYWIPPPTKATI
ncbi:MULTISPECIES: response regulator [Calothrix]|uniref:Response regulator n=2 Tax=Calothrix TaxID=1186 RepID=A0ABR8AA08_9CYAN|nr:MULTISPECIES: response regulator [Calothrix]MBD2196771.1 response regulator [Calothrix parietina FACHB-288]MBD2204700.1 response regulator [Calothrix sp. FACHB-168]MBD2216788.1 response regulator [Calothrix sp. FACHB-1219]MBD2225323.1 response regulator [Calothrix anomala FACHB-343]